MNLFEAIKRMRELSRQNEPFGFVFMSYNETAQKSDGIVEVRRARLRARTQAAHHRNAEIVEEYVDLDTVKLFRWRDAWCRIEGTVSSDSVVCRVESIDTLRPAVHRVPRKFLFIRWGTKAIRQEIVSTNPHTRIVYAEYIDMRRKRK